MTISDVKVVNRAGIHTRPAASLVKLASEFKSEIQILRDNFVINAKSIIGVMTLAAEQGSILQIKADGVDESEAVSAIVKLIQEGFGEI
ncbi:MAG: HPr family phosphocarrier protein [bacterium]